MSRPRDGLRKEGFPSVRLETDYLKVDLTPRVRGRVLSLLENRTGHEFLWRSGLCPLA